MTKFYLSTIFLLTFLFNLTAQQIEFGVFGGYSFHNITNTKISDGKAVIGDPIWDLNKGVLVSYYFKNDAGVKLTGLVSNIDKGSKSEKVPDAKFQYNSTMFGLLIGYGGDVTNRFRMYADIGMGYTKLDTNHGYNSLTQQTTAFPNLEQDLEMKGSEYNFLFDLGVEYILFPNWKAFLEMYTDPAVYRFNTSGGRYQNQGIGFNLGVKYFIPFHKGNKI